MKILICRFIILLNCHLLSFGLIAYGENDASVRNLMDQAKWPTVDDVLSALKPWPAKNPFDFSPEQYADSLVLNEVFNLQYKIKNFASYLPGAIARMEWAYPGATYAMIGRDVFLLGDALDLFYRTHGQEGRVIRLEVSGGSFSRQDKGVITAILRTAGLEMASQKILFQDPPFVMVDQSNYRDESQSTALLAGGFEEMFRHKIDLDLAIKKFGFMNAGLMEAVPITPKLSLNRFFGLAALDLKDRYARRNIEQRTLSPESETFIYPKEHLSLSPNLKSSFSHGPQWHGPFARVQQRVFGDNTFAAHLSAPKPTPKIDRQEVLYLLYELANVVRQESFLQGVIKESLALGFNFPVVKNTKGVHAGRYARNQEVIANHGSCERSLLP